MYEEIFTTLDLSPNEGKIYLSLLEHGESSISAIAVNARIHRRNAYDAIGRLINKGLVFEVWSPTENKYGAVSPEKLRELLADQQRQLETALPDLVKKYQGTHSEQASYIFKGYEGMKNIWREILRAKVMVYTLGGKGQWFDKRLGGSDRAFFKEIQKQKIPFKILFDHETIPRFPLVVAYYKGIGQYRILPKDYSTNCTIHIFGDYVVLYTGVTYGELDPDSTFFITQSAGIADSYRRWFDYMWDLSGKGKKSAVPTSATR